MTIRGDRSPEKQPAASGNHGCRGKVYVLMAYITPVILAMAKPMTLLMAITITATAECFQISGKARTPRAFASK